MVSRTFGSILDVVVAGYGVGKLSDGSSSIPEAGTLTSFKNATGGQCAITFTTCLLKMTGPMPTGTMCAGCAESGRDTYEGDNGGPYFGCPMPAAPPGPVLSPCLAARMRVLGTNPEAPSPAGP